MLNIDGQLCYSDHPPERYTVDGRGHGNMLRHNLRAWNLIYLSLPIVDGYLKDDASLEKLWTAKDIKDFGIVASLVMGAASRTLWPDLNLWLQGAPIYFLRSLQKLDWKKMPPNMEIAGWMDNIEERVYQITYKEAVQEVEHDLYKRLGVKHE